jgi:UDP-3-O-[3-hydroxymyristoyl] glucosamine N-acyltransferase
VGSHAVIEEGAVLGDDVTIYPMAYVGRGVRIGPRTVVHPHVTICEGVEIGSDCLLHPNCLIGDEGFGLIQREGRSVRRRQVGGVRIGDRVEVGGFCSIDRGMMEDTVIGSGVKMDKHCHIAHNCRIGDDCVLVAYARLAGSVTVGRGCILAADVGISDHVTVGDGVMIGAGSALMSDVKSGERVLGAPARPIGEAMRIMALEGKLPEMHRTLVQLKKEVESLKTRLEKTP